MGDEKISNKTKLTLIVIGVLALLMIVMVVAKKKAPSSENVLNRAIDQIGQAQGLHIKTKLVINLPEKMRSKQRPLTRVETVVEGDTKILENGGAELTGDLNVEARGAGNIFFTKGQLRAWAGETAFRLDEFPVLLNPSGSLSKRWTYVPVGLLETKENNTIMDSIRGLGQVLVYQGKEDYQGEEMMHFNGMLTEGVEQKIQEAWQMDSSGDRSLDVVARLLAANNVKNFDVWVSVKDNQLRRTVIDFVRPLSDGGEFDFATLELDLSDYGKVVEVERPKKETTVRPEVFAKLFGTGEVTEVKTKEE